MTRSWELGIWRVKNEQANGKEKVYFKLSMTAEAFRYWLLVKDNIIDKNSVYENQVRKSFSNGDLDVSTLKNPLHTDLDGCGGFGVGMILTAEKYQQLSQEFEKFFLSN
jgi:hypothetical protein